MRPLAVRGAITVEADQVDLIKAASVELVSKILKENHIESDDIIMLFVTMTSDLRSINAASTIRLGLALDEVPFFAAQEPEINGMLERCIRVLIQYTSNNSKDSVKHIYLGKAANLRPDLNPK